MRQRLAFPVVVMMLLLVMMDGYKHLFLNFHLLDYGHRNMLYDGHGYVLDNGYLLNNLHLFHNRHVHRHMYFWNVVVVNGVNFVRHVDCHVFAEKKNGIVNYLRYSEVKNYNSNVCYLLRKTPWIVPRYTRLENHTVSNVSGESDTRYPTCYYIVMVKLLSNNAWTQVMILLEVSWHN